MNRRLPIRNKGQSGFTLVEMLIATVVVLVGLVAVAQLVPMSVLLNATNRNDGTALVFAQRQMEALRGQPFGSNTFTDPLGVFCPISTTCFLGDPLQPNKLVGSPVVLNSNNSAPLIDFSQSQVPGYYVTYIDPNDPFQAPYDVRWAVVTNTNGQAVCSRRLIVGVVRRSVETPSVPITLDTIVVKQQ
jgi:prepilin-type N-terminal cleavage/methylation domain-containing protein